MDASNSQEIQGETGATRALGLSEKRFCDDCCFFRLSPEHTDPLNRVRFGRCAHHLAPPMSEGERFVSASLTGSLAYASVTRAIESRCGPEAKWFEPRPATAEAADMSPRTYQDAYSEARKLAQAGDRKGADALMCRLLWLVRAEDGGFVGLSDKQLEAKVEADPRLNMEDVNRFWWAPGEWPVASESGLTLPTRTEADARAERARSAA